MAIQLIDYLDKADGATGTTGQISSSDINQIKTKANAAVTFLNALANLFTLDGNGLPVAVKNSALPDINIFDKFSSDFVISNGLIALSGGSSSLPVPPPLTNGVADDVANTFTGTIPNGYAATDVERTFDGGITWAVITSLPLAVGDIAYSIGQVGLRIKATSERQHSSTLYNVTAFTVSGGGSNPDTGFTPVTAVTFDADITQNSNSLLWTHTTGNDNRFWTVPTLKVNSGSPFEFRFTIDPTKSTGYMGVSQYAQGYKFAKLQWQRNSDTHGQMLTFFNGSYKGSPGLDLTTPARGRIKGDGTNITIDYSIDGGNTWVNVDTNTQPALALELQGEFIYVNSQTTLGINNIIEKGMAAA